LVTSPVLNQYYIEACGIVHPKQKLITPFLKDQIVPLLVQHWQVQGEPITHHYIGRVVITNAAQEMIIFDSEILKNNGNQIHNNKNNKNVYIPPEANPNPPNPPTPYTPPQTPPNASNLGNPSQQIRGSKFQKY
jgi:hypothetical protein